MRDYLNGWTEETAKMIPPIERTKGQKPAVKIREYIPPIAKQEEAAYEEEATVLLSRSPKVSLRLRREKTGEEIEVETDSFLLGKGTDCNYVIQGNASVSRHHAKIWKEEDFYVLQDLNSLNHTFVNGNEISEAVKLENGTRILLADEAFEALLEVE